MHYSITLNSSLESKLTSAPFSTKNLATIKCPLLQAHIKGVIYLGPAKSIFAPSPNKTSTILKSPL